jgi:hypothetical protein
MPTSRDVVLANPAKTPAALDPPPHTRHEVRDADAEFVELSCGFVTNDALHLSHHPRKWVRAHDRTQAVMRRRDTRHPLAHGLVDRVLQGRLPDKTGTTVAPSSCMRKTLRAWRTVSTSPMKTVHSRPSRAAAVAVATPCCPAPVSAITRLLPMRLGEQGLTDDVVDLVRPGVREVLALGVDVNAQFL